MKRLVTVLSALALAVVAGGSVTTARQVQQDPSRPPGLMSQAKVLIINKSLKEAIPVSIESPDIMRVQVAGTAAVQIAGTPNVQARRARQMWEYRQLVLPAGQDPTASLNAAGLDGWEATGIALPTSDATRIILKRPTDR